MTEPKTADRPPSAAGESVRRRLVGPALAVVSLAVFLALLELFAYRAISRVPEPLAGANPMAQVGLDVSDVDLFWRCRPNCDVSWRYRLSKRDRWRTMHVKTNAFGLRDRDRTREKPSGVFRILSLGESSTFGDKVEQTETYSYLLEELLNADSTLHRSVEVWNCGIISYSSYQSIRWLERDGLAFQPDMVVFYHEVNDFLPTVHRAGDAQAVGLGRTDRELGAMRGRLGPMMAILERSHFYRWLRIRVLLAASRAVAFTLDRRQPEDKRAPGSPYDSVLVTHLPWDDVQMTGANPTDWPDTLPYMENKNPLCRVPDSDRLELLTGLVRTVRARHIDLVLIHPAYMSSRSHRCVLTELAKSEGVPFIEVERIVRSTGLPRSEIFMDTYHPSARTHSLIADELARVVRPQIPAVLR